MSHKIGEETIPVRQGEELDLTALEWFLRKNIDGLPYERLEIRQFSAGHSNLTYQLKMGDWEAVLRRPPLGPVAPKAHDMEREHKIISEIHPLFSPAPNPILFSDDTTIVGSPFQLMERKHGIVLDTSFPESIKPTEEIGKRLSEIMVDRLAELHSIDYKKTRLGEISKPEGFMERQVHGWINRYQRAKTDEIKEADLLTEWLAKHSPKKHEASIIHYDYKFNNAMFNHELTEMVGLFDWEMTTVGDPLADLGVALGYWVQSDDPDLLKKGFSKPSVTVYPGFLTRNEFIERYAEKSGRDVENINFYLTFAYFKLAVILQQIYYRYKKGQTSDERFSKFNETVRNLIIYGTHVAFSK
ncbi:Predicted kinase, aminoglycoside phosphotransferase (APT) family [Mesobacillus persicus]|uniref:Predicted kinase, aminoglycoside phosphotransferase (APT) family n=1 Tax=Mesobacillus persicus TaxID=930146 RepID=A0A1H8EA43_9BACI|nr:phosphotransferase family protein [Mesobacillus persicus]SEN16004.1 Predicted kinase, aminoglycoside phosphotransferase (APT) family [Mesobacillus persicus]